MIYYLSYIEANGHAALMLSHQEALNEPVKVLYEVGFGYILPQGRPWPKVGYFSTLRGAIREEKNASKAIYSQTSVVKHRTYEISKAEMEKFFFIINRDSKFSVPEDSSKATLSENSDGLGYQLFKNNCKTYVMSLFKELGILEANNVLTNFGIQRPGTTDKYMQNLSGELSCPVKDESLEKIMESLSEMRIKFDQLNTTIENFKKEPLSVKELERIDRIKIALAIAQKAAKFIEQNKWKIGISSEANKEIGDNIMILNKSLEQAHHLSKKTRALLQKDIEQLMSHYTIIENQATEIVYASADGHLEFFWKKVPPTAPRIYLEHFSATERAYYRTKNKIDEVLNGYEKIISELEQCMHQADKKAPDLALDMEYLLRIVNLSQRKIHEAKEKFIESYSKSTMEAPKNRGTPEETVALCHQHYDALMETVGNLEQKLSNYKSFCKNTKETALFVRYINQILAYFKQDYVVDLQKKTGLLKNKLQSFREESLAENTKAWMKKN